MNYDWENDKNWEAYLKSQKAHPKGKDELEVARRAYYNTKIVKNFEETFEFPSD